MSIPHHGEKVIEYIVPESDFEELTERRCCLKIIIYTPKK